MRLPSKKTARVVCVPSGFSLDVDDGKVHKLGVDRYRVVDTIINPNSMDALYTKNPYRATRRSPC